MKRLTFALALVAFAAPASSQIYHRGYVRQDGTYVAPHYQSRPDSSVSNNWSSQGNVNPYTGQPGTVNPYSTPNYGTTPRSNCYYGVCSPLRGF